MWLRAVVESLRTTYTGIAFSLVLFSGLLTIMMERFLYMRREYKREAAITAVIGWTYVLGGTLLYATIWVLSSLIG